MNITDAQADFVAEVAQTLVAQGFRVEADLRNEKIGYKIRQHTLDKVPYLLVVGDREKDAGAVAVRTRRRRPRFDAARRLRAASEVRIGRGLSLRRSGAFLLED
jgi:threonyl-tRNA synthetase